MLYYKPEKYIVLYGSNQFEKYDTQEFSTIERALAFAEKKNDEGYDITIKQVRILKNWEWYLHTDATLTDDDIEDDDELPAR